MEWWKEHAAAGVVPLRVQPLRYGQAAEGPGKAIVEKNCRWGKGLPLCAARPGHVRVAESCQPQARSRRVLALARRRMPSSPPRWCRVLAFPGRDFFRGP